MEVQYKASIQDTITEYDTLNVKARITDVAYWTMLMRGLPPQIFKPLSRVILADNTNNERREIIITTGKNVEVWKATEGNCGIINKP
jgi:hypothetical protein